MPFQTKKFVFSQRDREILSALLLFRIMKTSHIAALFFSTSQTALNRMVVLRKNGYVSSVNFSTWGKRDENVWSLTRKGLYEAKNWLSYYNWTFKSLNLKVESVMMAHDLRIVDVFVSLVKNGHLTIKDLFLKKFMETRFADVRLSNYGNSQRLRPDARFILEDRTYWLEIDRGTEKIDKITAKIQRYKTYFDSDPEGIHIVLFLSENSQNLTQSLYDSGLDNVRWKTSELLGVFGANSRIEWFTLGFDEGLEILNKQIIPKSFFRAACHRLAKIGMAYADAEGYFLKNFDLNVCPSAVPPAAWYGLKRKDNDKGQFYVVENIIGGASGGLYRLRFFPIQQSEFTRVKDGLRPRLLLIVRKSQDLNVVLKHYPELNNEIYFVTWEELFAEPFRGIIHLASGERSEL